MYVGMLRKEEEEKNVSMLSEKVRWDTCAQRRVRSSVCLKIIIECLGILRTQAIDPDQAVWWIHMMQFFDSRYIE